MSQRPIDGRSGGRRLVAAGATGCLERHVPRAPALATGRAGGLEAETLGGRP